MSQQSDYLEHAHHPFGLCEMNHEYTFGVALHGKYHTDLRDMWVEPYGRKKLQSSE